MTDVATLVLCEEEIQQLVALFDAAALPEDSPLRAQVVLAATSLLQRRAYASLSERLDRAEALLATIREDVTRPDIWRRHLEAFCAAPSERYQLGVASLLERLDKENRALRAGMAPIGSAIYHDALERLQQDCAQAHAILDERGVLAAPSLAERLRHE